MKLALVILLNLQAKALTSESSSSCYLVALYPGNSHVSLEWSKQEEM